MEASEPLTSPPSQPAATCVCLCHNPMVPKPSGAKTQWCWLQLSLYLQGTEQGSCPSDVPKCCGMELGMLSPCWLMGCCWLHCARGRPRSLQAALQAGDDARLSVLDTSMVERGQEWSIWRGGCLGAVVVPVPRREVWLRAAGCLPLGMPAFGARCFLGCGSQLISRAVWEGCVPGRASPSPAAPW